MGQYLEIVGNSNTIIIDDEHPWLQLTRVLDLSCDECKPLARIAFSGSDYKHYDDSCTNQLTNYLITLQDHERFVAFAPQRAAPGNAFSGTFRDKSHYIFRWYQNNGAAALAQPDVKIYIYGEIKTAPAHGCGLQVFDSKGNMVFTSDNKLLNIRGTYINTYAPSEYDRRYAHGLTRRFFISQYQSDLAITVGATLTMVSSEPGSTGFGGDLSNLDVCSYPIEFRQDGIYESRCSLADWYWFKNRPLVKELYGPYCDDHTRLTLIDISGI